MTLSTVFGPPCMSCCPFVSETLLACGCCWLPVMPDGGVAALVKAWAAWSAACALAD